jgi:hypothetical protein
VVLLPRSEGDGLPQPGPDSLDFFLIERYCLYAARKAKLNRADLSQILAPAHGEPALVPFD